MKISLLIATRYLFARKSHNVINIISAISAAGMAIGTAALILILSVYNGFDDIIRKNLADIDPDILVAPATGKSFIADEELVSKLSPLCTRIDKIIEENVFLRYSGSESLAKAKGVEDGWNDMSTISSHVVDGEFRLKKGDLRMANCGAGLAYKMGIRPRFVDKLKIYFPESPTSLREISLIPASLVSISTEADAQLVILPIEEMRTLLGWEEDKVTCLEMRGVRLSANEITSILGPEYRVMDKYHQHPELFKMMKYEKAAIFLILIFIVIIIAFNIFGSLSMLIMEKSDDISTLRSIGAGDGMIRRIFALEGWLISVLGMSIGLAAGIVLALAQQHLGIVKMPGNYLIESYPVILQWQDILLTAAGVSIIGLIISLSAGRNRLLSRSERP